MTYRTTRWPLLLQTAPKKAEKEIRRALRQTKTVAEAAEKLHLERAHLYRMMARLGIKLKEIRRPAGAYCVNRMAS